MEDKRLMPADVIQAFTTLPIGFSLYWEPDREKYRLYYYYQKLDGDLWFVQALISPKTKEDVEAIKDSFYECALATEQEGSDMYV